MKKIYLILVLLSPFPISEVAGQSKLLFKASPLYKRDPSFAEVDVSKLIVEVRRREVPVPEEELAQRLHRNVRFIFYNKLNKHNFLTQPRPQELVDRIVEIFRVEDQLSHLLVQGRRLAANDGRLKEKKRLIREMRGCAEDLHDTFTGYFLDVHSSSFRFFVPSRSGKRFRFLHFVIQSERILHLLEGRVNRYFLDTSPGTVSVRDYRDYSITVLCRSLKRLSEMTESRMH